jgi:hypothetical protein
MIVSERDGPQCSLACEMKGEFTSPVQQVLCACRAAALEDTIRAVAGPARSVEDVV